MKVSIESLVSQAATLRFGLEPEICILDVETTGFNPTSDDIIEIAIIKMDGPDIVDEFSSFARPRKPISARITELTTITDDDVVGAPTTSELAPKIRTFIGDCPILAHNASFDRSFVEATCGTLPGAWLDSIEITRIAFPHLRAHNQEALVAEFLPDKTAGLHRALNDVEALAHLWRMSLVAISQLDSQIVSAMVRVASPKRWPLGSWIAMVADWQRGATGIKPKPLDLRTLRREQVKPDTQPDFWDAYECPSLDFSDFTEVVAALGAEGIAGRMYPSFEDRQEQIDMAVEVNDAFAASTHLAVEAGTGVGKSLAYLIPAALIAQRNSITIGVGTKTNALTDQLMKKELPLLNDALGGTLRYTALKGYEHYLCLAKLETQLADLTLEPYEVCVALAWIVTHPWGDLESVNFYWKSDAHWTLRARSLECSKRKCRFYPHLCYVHGARVRARSSHIVVTNHALLFRDNASSGALLPPMRYLILDEAQGVSSEARRQLAVTVSSDEIGRDISHLNRQHSGLIAQVRRRIAQAGSHEEEVAESLTRFEQQLNRAQSECSAFVEALVGLASADRRGSYTSTDIRIDESIRAGRHWAEIVAAGTRLHDAIAESVIVGRGVITCFEQEDESLPQVVSDLNRVLMAWASHASHLEEVLAAPTENVFTYAHLYLPRDPRRFPSAELTAAAVEMGPLIAQGLLAEHNSVVFTSATLDAGDDFASFAHSVGLDVLGAEAYQTIRLASSFDLPRQMKLFIISDIVPPTDPSYHDQIEAFLEEVHTTMQGGVLTLFTNRSDLSTLHGKLKDRLHEQGLALLAQDRKLSIRTIKERFLSEPTTSLFATKSFWEGFDAIGDTLRCVIIARIPFAQPSDPLAQARREVDPHSWERFVLPEALIEIKQAVGRLIRSATDTGFVIIADSRAAHAGYASRIQAALPVEPVVATRSEIIDALAGE